MFGGNSGKFPQLYAGIDDLAPGGGGDPANPTLLSLDAETGDIVANFTADFCRTNDDGIVWRVSRPPLFKSHSRNLCFFDRSNGNHALDNNLNLISTGGLSTQFFENRLHFDTWLFGTTDSTTFILHSMSLTICRLVGAALNTRLSDTITSNVAMAIRPGTTPSSDSYLYVATNRNGFRIRANDTTTDASPRLRLLRLGPLLPRPPIQLSPPGNPTASPTTSPTVLPTDGDSAAASAPSMFAPAVLVVAALSFMM